MVPYLHFRILGFPCIVPYSKTPTMIEGSLEARKKLGHGESYKGENERWRRSDIDKARREKMQVRRGRKVAKHCVFLMFCGSGGSKSGLAKAAGAEPAGQMRDEKMHAVVARSTFESENCQNTRFSDHFLTFSDDPIAIPCRKSAFGSQTCEKLRVLSLF